MTPAAWRSARSVSVSPSSARRIAAVCSPTHGTRCLGALGHLRQLHRVAGNQHRLLDAVHRAPSRRSCCGRSRCGSRDHLRDWKHGPAATPAAVSSFAASTMLRSTAHASTPGRMMSSRCAPQPSRVARRGSSIHSGRPITRGQRCELVLADELHHEPTVGGAEGVEDERASERAASVDRATPGS